MRKRLIEKFTKSKEGTLGYTLTELLVVIAIIAILVAIAIPSIIAISRALKFKRVNDHAKSIFLAAQQNLTEMRSDGGLKPLQSAEGAGMIPAAATSFPGEFRTEYVYTTTGTAAFELILPAGSVDGTVRAEQIIIEYNPITGNVYSVFYCEDDDQNIATAYTASDLPREDKSARKDMMLGYYDGSGLNSSQIELEEIKASVEFINGEEGIVRVLVPVPDDFFGNLDEYAKAMTINLSVTGEYSMVQAAAGAAEGESGETAQTPGYVFSVPIKVAGPGLGENCYVEYGNTIVVEYPIDSLVNYGSFANYSSSTYDGAKNAGGTDAKAHLTDLMDETRFTILPGENVTLEAEVKVDSEIRVEVENGILSGVNPMFEYLQPDGSNGYVLAVSNGRNLQNLNAIAPTIAKQVSSVVFTSDIYWNDTVSYYNDKYDTKTSAPGYQNAAGENPARALPYFVPIHNEDLFGTAKFIFPGEGDGGLGGLLGSILNAIFGGYTDSKVPTLTDEMDTVTGVTHASIQGNGHKVYNLNVDSTQYTVPNMGEKGSIKNPQTNEYVETDLTGTFYATGQNQIIDYCFTGLFGYVNTPIDGLHVVNPIIKGHEMTKETTVVQNYIYIFGIPFPAGTTRVNLYNNPATGALVGAGGFNTLVTNCSTYIDKDARGYIAREWGPKAYSVSGAQTWYGVSGEGAVGGLVGYAKSHRNVTGELTDDNAVLAFSKCFAAVPVSGNMRTATDKNFGYSNGVGAFIGNSQLTNFYNCYASGNVMANGCRVGDTLAGGLLDSITQIFGIKLDLLYNGRTSWGAGGFVGTSHGTRYTNCFATGDVNAASASALGAGGFVGFMSIDETFTYGNLNKEGKESVAQRTVFTDCYSVGIAVTNGTTFENFSGANGRIAFSLNQSMTYVVGDYFRLYAPYYTQYKTAPGYESVYIYRDSYFLSNYHDNAQKNSSTCAEPEPYSTFEDLVGNHGKSTSWTDSQIKAIKDIVLYTTREGNWWDGYETVYHTYETEYFNKIKDDGLTTIYRNLYDEGYSVNEWNKATASTTHPYSMPNGSVYPFTKLAGMDYYGDWPSKPSAMGLAYYEAYATDPEKNQFFFDKEHDDNASLHLNDGENVMVVEDGYAIFSANNAAMTVTVNGVTDTLAASGERYTVSNNTYHVFYLSDKLMKALPANGEFYCTVTAKHGTGDTYTMYFNPSVAISHVNPTDGKTAAAMPDAAPKTIYVRSARQFKAIAALEDFWGKGYSYIQQLNIDAVKYSWEDAERKVSSIGNAQKPFNASYSAGYTVEGDIAKQYKLSGFLFADNAAGFFGTIGKDGSIDNLIVECDAVSVGGKSVSDVAVLAGRNEGTISNVNMVLKNLTTLTAADNAGLLAGYNSGIVRDCEVSAAAVTVNAKNGGGLIGSVEGTANAKAKVSGCKLTLTGDLTVTGTGNAGGLIGQAKHLTLTATEPLVTMTKLTAANAAYAGGLAGWMEDSEIKITDAASVTTVTFNTVSAAKGTAAGFLGGGKNVAANGVDVTAGTVSGNIAAGFLGTGTNVDAAYCDVVITNGIQGKAKAAGVAGTIGAQSVFEYVTVNLGTKVEATEGNAAGYAVELAAETDVMNGSVTLNNTTISAPKGKAAGYACSAAGYVGSSNGSSVPSSVVRKDGKNTISGANAAGFACEITGQVSGAFVTPALDSSKYLGNSNKNLVVNGTSSAAGFALTVGEDATVTNCYALNKITGASVTGFVGTNKGTISGCMANVTIDGGYAFVEKNEGTVSRCYGWYGDDKAETATVATVNGKCFSAYFADLNPADKEGDIVTLYAADGTVQTMSATALQGAAEILANASNKWYTTGYNSYPYTQKPSAMPNYLYPMLRDHYGDWITPPQYAYGVAYYETYEVTASAAEPADAADAAEVAETPAPTTTTVVKLHMVDLSDSTVTEEKQAISTYLVDQAGKVTTSVTTVFNNEYTIKTSGYAVFGKKDANVLASMSGSETPLFTYTLSNNKDAKNITYEFFPLKTDSAKDGVVTIGATAVSKNTAAVQTWFADAIFAPSIGANVTYIVRTPEQLAKIGAVAANFSQTHDIAVTDFTTVEKLSGNYAGNDLKLSVSGQTKTWMSTVDGTVQNLNLEIPNGVNAPVFGTVSQGANVTLSGLKIGAVGAEGALANVVSGTMTVPAISTPAVSGKLFGDSDGTVNTGAITVSGEVATLFGNVANVTVDGAIQTGKVNTQLFGNVSGTVSTGAINVTGTAAQVFGNVNANTDKNINVTVNGVITLGGTGKVFGTVGAEVAVTGLITTGDLTGNAITAANAKMTLSGITVGDVPAGSYVIAGFGNGANEVKTSDVTVTKNIAGNVFGDVNGTVKTGAVSTQMVGSVTTTTEGEGESATTNTTVNPANIFGDINGGTVTVASVTTNGQPVYGNVFGDITSGTVTSGTITTGALSGNIFGEVSANVTADGVTVASADANSKIVAAVNSGTTTVKAVTVQSGDVPTLFGAVANGATLTGGETAALVQLNAGNLSGNLFGSAAGTVQNFNVTTTGDMNAPLVGDDLGGILDNVDVSCASAEVAGGVLVNSVASGAKAESCDVVVTGEAKISGTNAGGLTGSNAGTLTDNTVTIGTLTATGTDATVGGLVGTNGGTISGAEVSATINHTGNGGVTIGGIVGNMTGGSLTDSEASGSINAPENLTNMANIIGGAVGKAFENTTYSGTISTISLSDWGKATLHNAEDVTSDAVKAIISPDGNGPIGQFVGYAATGTSFTNCSGNGGSATYQFLGQVQHTGFETFKAGTYGEFEVAWGTNTYTEANKEAYDAAKEQYTAEGKAIATFNVTLSECYYTNATNRWQQTIGDTKYYADGTEEEYKVYATSLVNPTITPTGNADLIVTSFGTNTSQTLTNWYYKSGNDYYRVWYKYEYAERLWGAVKYYGVQLWADTNMDGSLSNNERFVNISGSDFGNTDANKKIDKTLYTLSDISVSDGNYLIVGGGSKALSNSGAAVNFASTFNTKGGANADLVDSIWTNTAGVWNQGSNYLNLNTDVIGEQKSITAGIARAGASGLSVSLNGGKNLIFRNNAFDVNANQIGAISLYSVSSSPVYEMTFTNDRYGQVIGKKDMGVIPTSVSEETEIPAEEIGGETGNNT